MATFTEILRTAVHAASSRVLDGSRRNAEDAIVRRRAEERAAMEVMSALRRPPGEPRRSA